MGRRLAQMFMRHTGWLLNHTYYNDVRLLSLTLVDRQDGNIFAIFLSKLELKLTLLFLVLERGKVNRTFRETLIFQIDFGVARP